MVMFVYIRLFLLLSCIFTNFDVAKAYTDKTAKPKEIGLNISGARTAT